MKSVWDSSAGVKENAALHLPGLAMEYFEAGAALFTGGNTPEELHRFRLRTKHFRYTMELFEGEYGVRFGALMKKLKPVQDALGEINDAATALMWMQEGEPAAAREFLSARIATKSAAFAEYWKKVFDKPGERKRWQTVLAQPLRGTKEG